MTATARECTQASFKTNHIIPQKKMNKEQILCFLHNFNAPVRLYFLHVAYNEDLF